MPIAGIVGLSGGNMLKYGLITGAGLLLAGCAAPIIGGLTVSQVMTAATVGSYLATGKGTGELALSVVTGKDCRLLEGALRKDREICEDPQSPATAEDFKGLPTIVAALKAEDAAGTPPVLTAATAGDEVMPEFTDIHEGHPVSLPVADQAPSVREQPVIRTASLETVTDDAVAGSLFRPDENAAPLPERRPVDVPTVSTGRLMAPGLAAVRAHEGHIAARVVWKPAMRPFTYRILPTPAEAPRSAIFSRGSAAMPKRRPVTG